MYNCIECVRANKDVVGVAGAWRPHGKGRKKYECPLLCKRVGKPAHDVDIPCRERTPLPDRCAHTDVCRHCLERNPDHTLEACPKHVAALARKRIVVEESKKRAHQETLREKREDCVCLFPQTTEFPTRLVWKLSSDLMRRMMFWLITPNTDVLPDGYDYSAIGRLVRGLGGLQLQHDAEAVITAHRILVHPTRVASAFRFESACKLFNNCACCMIHAKVGVGVTFATTVRDRLRACDCWKVYCSHALQRTDSGGARMLCNECSAAFTHRLSTGEAAIVQQYELSVGRHVTFPLHQIAGAASLGVLKCSLPLVATLLAAMLNPWIRCPTWNLDKHRHAGRMVLGDVDVKETRVTKYVCFCADFGWEHGQCSNLCIDYGRAFHAVVDGTAGEETEAGPSAPKRRHHSATGRLCHLGGARFGILTALLGHTTGPWRITPYASPKRHDVKLWRLSDHVQPVQFEDIMMHWIWTGGLTEEYVIGRRAEDVKTLLSTCNLDQTMDMILFDMQGNTRVLGTLLHMAVRLGRVGCVRTLLEYGANPNVRSGACTLQFPTCMLTCGDWTSAHVAAMCGNYDMLRLLCANYANLHALDYQFVPAYADNVQVMKEFQGVQWPGVPPTVGLVAGDILPRWMGVQLEGGSRQALDAAEAAERPYILAQLGGRTHGNFRRPYTAGSMWL